MQTAIHFEGDLAYICVSDQGEIKMLPRNLIKLVLIIAQPGDAGCAAIVS